MTKESLMSMPSKSHTHVLCISSEWPVFPEGAEHLKEKKKAVMKVPHPPTFGNTDISSLTEV